MATNVVAPTLDEALSAVTAAEATLAADQNTVTNIKTAISTATAPLPAAEAQVTTDAGSYNSAVDAAILALQASKVDPTSGLPVPPVPPISPSQDPPVSI